ncbi:hypothetical protein [Methanocella sp. MCL-LM]|uniref:hypothetical protein n=1 Tax=Methanocella sp. MCL-LM TaxID=3412035 RepID=UPI003C78D0B5
MIPLAGEQGNKAVAVYDAYSERVRKRSDDYNVRVADYESSVAWYNDAIAGHNKVIADLNQQGATEEQARMMTLQAESLERDRVELEGRRKSLDHEFYDLQQEIGKLGLQYEKLSGNLSVTSPQTSPGTPGTVTKFKWKIGTSIDTKESVIEDVALITPEDTVYPADQTTGTVYPENIPLTRNKNPRSGVYAVDSEGTLQGSIYYDPVSGRFIGKNVREPTRAKDALVYLPSSSGREEVIKALGTASKITGPSTPKQMTDSSGTYVFGPDNPLVKAGIDTTQLNIPIAYPFVKEGVRLYDVNVAQPIKAQMKAAEGSQKIFYLGNPGILKASKEMAEGLVDLPTAAVGGLADLGAGASILTQLHLKPKSQEEQDKLNRAWQEAATTGLGNLGTSIIERPLYTATQIGALRIIPGKTIGVGRAAKTPKPVETLSKAEQARNSGVSLEAFTDIRPTQPASVMNARAVTKWTELSTKPSGIPRVDIQGIGTATGKLAETPDVIARTSTKEWFDTPAIEDLTPTGKATDVKIGGEPVRIEGDIKPASAGEEWFGNRNVEDFSPRGRIYDIKITKDVSARISGRVTKKMHGQNPFDEFFTNPNAERMGLPKPVDLPDVGFKLQSTRVNSEKFAKQLEEWNTMYSALSIGRVRTRTPAKPETIRPDITGPSIKARPPVSSAKPKSEFIVPDLSSEIIGTLGSRDKIKQGLPTITAETSGLKSISKPLIKLGSKPVSLEDLAINTITATKPKTVDKSKVRPKTVEMPRVKTDLKIPTPLKYKQVRKEPPIRKAGGKKKKKDDSLKEAGWWKRSRVFKNNVKKYDPFGGGNPLL